MPRWINASKLHHASTHVLLLGLPHGGCSEQVMWSAKQQQESSSWYQMADLYWACRHVLLATIKHRRNTSYTPRGNELSRQQCSQSRQVEGYTICLASTITHQRCNACHRRGRASKCTEFQA
eukprot:734097-Amphidinium_carterae.1